MQEDKQHVTIEDERDRFNPHENKSYKSDVDFTEILFKLYHIRRKIYWAIIVGLCLGIIVSFSSPKQYVVSVTLSPEFGTKIGGGFSGMAASLLGGNVSQGDADALNAQLAPQIVSSTPFLLELLDARIIDSSHSVDTTLFAYLDMQDKPWWNYMIAAPGRMVQSVKSVFSNKDNESVGSHLFAEKEGPIRLTMVQAQKMRDLRMLVSAQVDSKTSIITVKVRLQDPFVTAIVADSLVSKLQKHIVNYRISKAKEDCMYLEKLYKESQHNYYQAQQAYADYVDSNSNQIFESKVVEKDRLQSEVSLAYQSYTQVFQQLQMARAKVQEVKPVFTVLEPAVIPLQDSNISKKIIIIVFIFLSLLTVIFWEFVLKNIIEVFFKRFVSFKTENK